jgi:serine protease Do
MLNFRHILRRRAVILLILAGLAVAAGFVINQGADEFVVPTAIGDTNETFQETEDFQYLERANRAFINLVERTKPSIVQITVKAQRRVEQTVPRFQVIPPDGMDTEEFRRRFGDDWLDRFRDLTPREPVPSRPTRGVGSGVIVSDDGYILTNNHVIDRADEIIVTLPNGKEYEASLVGRDAAHDNGGGTDLAVIKIDANDLPVLPFGDSDALEVGEWVIAIGTPFNLSQTVTRGIVSAKERTGYTAYGKFIQTDAPINRGNSGGALINIRGELVGINASIATNGFMSGNIGLGFAIPSNLAQQILPDLIEKGKVERGWLGISMKTVDEDLADQHNLDKPQGVLVERVGEGSPAEKGGIRSDDVILKFDGQKIEDLSHLRNIVAATRVGKSVEVEVLRKGKEKQLTVKLGKRTEESLATLREEEQGLLFAGLRVQNLTPADAIRHGYSENETGVIVTRVETGSEAEKKGIKPGYLIQEMEYTKIKDLNVYADVLRNIRTNKENRILLYVKSPDGEGTGYVTLNLEPSDR